jgi:hypothetical protein
MRYLNVLIVAAFSGLLLAGCSSVAHVEKDRTVDFNSYHTYAWAETRPENKDSVKTKVSDLTERNIRLAVNNEMIRTGWKEVKHKPDVLLSFDVVYERGLKSSNNPMYSTPYSRMYFNPYTRRWNSFYFPSEFMGYDNDQRQVREGTLTISMIDARTDKTIWQGWTTEEVNSRNLTSKEIQNNVKSIFRKFDVAKN